MSKAQLVVEESALAAKQRELQALDAKIAQLKQEHAQKKDVLAELDSEHQIARARKVTLVSVGDDHKEQLSHEKKKIVQLSKKLSQCDEALECEQKELTNTKVAYEGLKQAGASLNAVRDELQALAGSAAKTAALAAAGGELPTDVVPAPMPEAGEELCKQLWPVDDGAQKEINDDLRQALQSQAVITALQRSLAVRAAEMREGLRQWGFAGSATMRTQELCSGLKETQTETIKKCAEMRDEYKRLQRDQVSEAATLTDLQKQNHLLQQRHSSLMDALASARDIAASCQAKRDARLDSADDAERHHEHVRYEYNEASKELELQRGALAELPAEAERRLSAQQRLAQMASDQAQRSLIQLQQSQEQLQSFKQAHQMVQDTCTALDGTIVAEKAAYAALQGDHERIHLELEALARNYLAALPPLPGLTAITSSKVPDSPLQADTTIDHAGDGMPSPNVSGLAGQYGHVDQTADGAIVADGKLVMSN